MTNPIFLVGGGKGGVGKSMLSMALLDYLRGAENAPLLIETDTSAPDVWKAYKGDVEKPVHRSGAEGRLAGAAGRARPECRHGHRHQHQGGEPGRSPEVRRDADPRPCASRSESWSRSG